MIRDMQNLDLGKIIRLMREENMKGRLLKKKKKKIIYIFGIRVLEVLKIVMKVELSLKTFKKCNLVLKLVELVQSYPSTNSIQLNK